MMVIQSFNRLPGILFSLIILPALVMISGNAFAVNSHNVQITVTGTVAGSSCTVIGGSSQTVNLGDGIGVAVLNSSNDAWVWSNFTIGLEHCPIGMNKATITFNGEPDPINALYYKNTAISTESSPAAKNVAIEVSSQLQGYKDLSNGQQMVTLVDSVTHQAAFYVKARAITPSGHATAGAVTGHLDYTVEYQ